MAADVVSVSLYFVRITDEIIVPRKSEIIKQHGSYFEEQAQNLLRLPSG
jgi:hypothetical protein